MDMMIPYLGPISRLQVEPKSAFHIAVIKESNMQRIKREDRQNRKLEVKDELSKKTLKETSDSSIQDSEEGSHLDTWA